MPLFREVARPGTALLAERRVRLRFYRIGTWREIFSSISSIEPAVKCVPLHLFVAGSSICTGPAMVDTCFWGCWPRR